MIQLHCKVRRLRHCEITLFPPAVSAAVEASSVAPQAASCDAIQTSCSSTSDPTTTVATHVTPATNGWKAAIVSLSIEILSLEYINLDKPPPASAVPDVRSPLANVLKYKGAHNNGTGHEYAMFLSWLCCDYLIQRLNRHLCRRSSLWMPLTSYQFAWKDSFTGESLHSDTSTLQRAQIFGKYANLNSVLIT